MRAILPGRFGCAMLGAMAMLAAPAWAQTDPVPRDRLYVTDPAACRLLETRGVGAFEDLDFLAMSFTDGIQGMEFHCNFFDVKTRPGNAFTVVTAMCEQPGDSYADLLAISAYNDDSIKISSMNDTLFAQLSGNTADADAPAQTAMDATGLPPGFSLYHRCDNLSELPH